MSEPQNGRRRALHWRVAASSPRLCCSALFDRLGFSGAWIGNLTVLEPYAPLYRRGWRWWRCFFAAGASTGPSGRLQNVLRFARFPQGASYLQLIFWGVAVLVFWSRSDFLRRAIFSIDHRSSPLKSCFPPLPRCPLCPRLWAATQTVTLSVYGHEPARPVPITVQEAFPRSMASVKLT